MSLVSMNWRPNERQLRQFAAIGAVVAPLATWSWSGHNLTATLTAVGCGVALLLAGWRWPRLVQPLFVALSLITLPIGLVVSEVVTFLVYYGVVVPLGLVMRLVGRDPLERRMEPERASYWQAKQNPSDPERNFRQY